MTDWLLYFIAGALGAAVAYANVGHWTGCVIQVAIALAATLGYFVAVRRQA